ncbi:MAG: hypothetical protein C0614_13315 [Desulfuromonas sp.]|nr:MAG: hypothetical protein C0614_13315 [Desulfuromonas sp.]
MLRTLSIFSLCLALFIPCGALASEPLALLETAAQADDLLQPGLENYRVRIETAKVGEMIERMTASMPKDVPRPPAPVISKYWQRGAPHSLIVAEGEASPPYVAQMVERFSSTLAVELNALLLPADKIIERRELAASASLKTTTVALGNNTIQRVRIEFPAPTDLNQAFYKTGIRLPQKQIVALTFDIDGNSGSINELTILTADRLLLTAEIRYKQVASGYLPERIQVTSPDGHIDDLLEVTFAEIDGFELPKRIVRFIRRPDLKDELDVTFSNYLVNQTLPEQVRQQLTLGN